MDGTKEGIGETVDVKIDTDRWYDLKIEVKGRDIRCFLDGKLVTETVEPAASLRLPVYASATRDNATGDVILKVVNMGDGPQTIKLNLAGMARVAPQATAEVLTGDPNAMNSLAEPARIVPRQEAISNAAPSFEHEFPGSSVTVLRLKS